MYISRTFTHNKHTSLAAVQRSMKQSASAKSAKKARTSILSSYYKGTNSSEDRVAAAIQKALQRNSSGAAVRSEKNSSDATVRSDRNSSGAAAHSALTSGSYRSDGTAYNNILENLYSYWG